jgi:hypothetical protein
LIVTVEELVVRGRDVGKGYENELYVVDLENRRKVDRQRGLEWNDRRTLRWWRDKRLEYEYDDMILRERYLEEESGRAKAGTL